MRRDRTLNLAATPDATLVACRRVFTELGWEVLEAGEERLVAMEVPFGLNCRTLPAEAEILVRAVSHEHTTLTLAGSVHGAGARRQLDAQMARLEKRIRAQLS